MATLHHFQSRQIAVLFTLHSSLSCNPKCWTRYGFHTTRVISNRASQVTRCATWDVRQEGSKQSRSFVHGCAAKKQRGKTKNLSERTDQDARTARIILALKTWISPFILSFSKDNMDTTACVYTSRYYIKFIISYIKQFLCWGLRAAADESRGERQRGQEGLLSSPVDCWHPSSDSPARWPAGAGNESMSSSILSLNSSYIVIFAVLGFCLQSQKKKHLWLGNQGRNPVEWA